MKYIYITTLSLYSLVSCGTDNSSDKQTVDQIIESKEERKELLKAYGKHSK